MNSERNLETILFDKAIRKVQVYLKLIGFHIDNLNQETLWKRLGWWSMFNIGCITGVILSQIIWLIQSVSTGKSFVELTRIAPCLALCILSNIQTFYFIKHGRQICELLEVIRSFQKIFVKKYLDNVELKILKNQMNTFYFAVNSLTILIIIGITGFGISPFVTTVKNYYSTGIVKLAQPFLLAYPFDETDVRFYPMLYIHQIWCATVAVLTVLAPGFLYYACSTFIIFQFHTLYNDLENVIPPEYTSNIKIMKNMELRRKCIKIITRHRLLIMCVDRMEFVYSESTLFNVVTSTFLICLTGFNVTNIKDVSLMLPFLQFLMMSLTQIYFMCYYGDAIMNYSMKVADAAYNCQWYRAEASVVKDLMIISARARKPCKLTAFGYTDVNFKTFTKILSSSWSYFALLTSLYQK